MLVSFFLRFLVGKGQLFDDPLPFGLSFVDGCELIDGLHLVVVQWATAAKDNRQALIYDFERELFEMKGTGSHKRKGDVATSSDIGLTFRAEVEVPSNVIAAVLWVVEYVSMGGKTSIDGMDGWDYENKLCGKLMK